MRYFELIEEKEEAVEVPAAVVPSKHKRTELIRIPAGAGPVQLYIRNGKVFVISDQPLDRVSLP